MISEIRYRYGVGILRILSCKNNPMCGSTTKERQYKANLLTSKPSSMKSHVGYSTGTGTNGGGIYHYYDYYHYRYYSYQSYYYLYYYYYFYFITTTTTTTPPGQVFIPIRQYYCT